MRLTPTDRLIMKLVELEVKNWHELSLEDKRQAIANVIKRHNIK